MADGYRLLKGGIVISNLQTRIMGLGQGFRFPMAVTACVQLLRPDLDFTCWTDPNRMCDRSKRRILPKPQAIELWDRTLRNQRLGNFGFCNYIWIAAHNHFPAEALTSTRRGSVASESSLNSVYDPFDTRDIGILEIRGEGNRSMWTSHHTNGRL